MVDAIAEGLGTCAHTVRRWIKRFNARGGRTGGRRRCGRPATYTPEEVGEVVAARLTDPQTLGLPFASWTLDRLAAYLNEEKGIAIKRSRIGEILQAEGLTLAHSRRPGSASGPIPPSPKKGAIVTSTPPRLRTAS